jgi:hypothetical protein
MLNPFTKGASLLEHAQPIAELMQQVQSILGEVKDLGRGRSS